MGGGADRDGVDFGREQEGGAATSQLVSSVWGEGDALGTKLLEEG